MYLLKDGQLVDEASQGEEIQFILDQTPFYAESGGQIADRGVIFADTVKVDIKDVKKHQMVRIFIVQLLQKAL